MGTKQKEESERKQLKTQLTFIDVNTDDSGSR